MRNYENQDHVGQVAVISNDKVVSFTKLTGLYTFSNHVYGLHEKELDGLNLTFKKRMRGGPGVQEIMDTSDGLKIKEDITTKEMKLKAAIFGLDCATSSRNVVATLFLQIHPQ